METALGYFINPLVVGAARGDGAAASGCVRRSGWRWASARSAVVVLTVDYGRLPWLALTLAFSFAGYGLVKKRLGLPAAEGLFVESAVLALPALGYLGWLTRHGGLTFGHVSAGHTALLVLAGAATAVPLLLFAGAANRLPLTGLGMIQYLAPILQLGCGVLIFHEPMPPARLAGFALVWLALIVFTADAIRQSRRTRVAARLPTPVPIP